MCGCVGFVMCVCVCVEGGVVCGCVYVWVLYCVGVCMCEFCNVCVCVGGSGL